MRRRRIDRLIRWLDEEAPATRIDALTALSEAWFARPHHRQVRDIVRAMGRTLRRDPLVEVRAHAALRMGGPSLAATPWWLDAIADADEHPTVRSAALEALGHATHYALLDDATRTVSPRVAAVVTAALKDDSAEVRMLALFAAGHMKLHDARPIIEGLREDSALVGAWTVGEEAADVLAYLDTGVWREREIVQQRPDEAEDDGADITPRAVPESARLGA